MRRLYAHRGMSALAPENTLSAFALCKPHGVDWVECDVDILADGTVVLSHDDSLMRCTNCQGYLADLTVNDLAHIDAGSWFSDAYHNEPLPTLEQFIALANQDRFNINIEIKACAQGWQQSVRLVDGVIEKLALLDPQLELIVSCFNPLILAEFKRRRPSTATACLFDSHSFQSDWLAIAQGCGASGIHLDNTHLTREKVQQVKKQGYDLNVYTVNNVARANELFNWGVDGVFTDIAHLFASHYRFKSQ